MSKDATPQSSPYRLENFGASQSGGKNLKEDKYFPNAERHHLHFDLPYRWLEEFLQLLSFGEEQLFHDTFYFVGTSKNGREVWLRRRRNLSKKTTPTWLLTECWNSKQRTLLRLNEFSPDSIETRLQKEDISFSKEKKLEEQFPEYQKFRFYRREAETKEFGKIDIDETRLGITLSAKISTPSQFENMKNFAKKYNLSTTSSKLMALKKGGAVSEHLCGLRFDILENEDSESSDDDWMDAWASRASSVVVPPLSGSPKFTNTTKDLTMARKLFNIVF